MNLVLCCSILNMGDDDMEKLLGDITHYRTKEKCYLIEHNDQDYLVIYGTKYCEIVNGELWDFISSFLKRDVDWKFVERRLIYNRDDENRESHKLKWKDYDKDIKGKMINIDKLYIDGEQQDSKSIESK